MRIFCKYEKTLFLIIFVIFLTFSYFIVIEFILGLLHLILPHQPPKNEELKAFITSAYFYPTSESLGNNAFALVMSINLAKSQDDYLRIQNGKMMDDTELSIYANNGTTSIVVTTDFIRVTPHDYCQMITVFATVQLLPNVQIIHLISEEGSTNIPFSLPSYKKEDFVVCFSPLYVYEQWQNFLLALHVYKKFGAFMHIYLVSCISPLFALMQKYEKSGYIKFQPWYRVNFPFIPPHIADPFVGIEFQNQASAYTDCLLQYKESAKYVAFFDMEDILIPKLAPTYYDEFQKIISKQQKSAYMLYRQEKYGIVAARKSLEFSTRNMLNSLRYKSEGQSDVSIEDGAFGRLVVNPQYINYTWIYPTSFSTVNDYIEVTQNTITNLHNIKWSDYNTFETRPLYLNTSHLLISTTNVEDIEADFREMIEINNLNEIFEDLPERHHYTISISKCLMDNYYNYLNSGKFGKIRCPGPQTCQFKNIFGVRCVHVNATHIYKKKMSPITFYYATEPHFTSEIGCKPQ